MHKEEAVAGNGCLRAVNAASRYIALPDGTSFTDNPVWSHLPRSDGKGPHVRHRQRWKLTGHPRVVLLKHIGIS